MTANRDALIRAALAPSAGLVVPADLGDRIQEQVLATPQQGPGLMRWAGWLGRLVPEFTPLPRATRVVLTALLLLALAFALALGIASQQDQALPSSVTSYHGGLAQDGVMPGPVPGGIPAILADVGLQGPLNNLSVPLVRDDVVFFADLRGHIDARRADDLTRVWLGENLAHGAEAPVLLGEILVVAGADGTVTGLDAASGQVGWTTPLAGAVESPLAGVDDRVIVGSTDGTVHLLSSVDGRHVATVDAQGPVKRSPPIADGTAYVAADSGVVTAFDVATGEVRWRLDLAELDQAPLSAPEVSTPALADGTLYVARGPNDTSRPHEIVAIDVATHEVRWRSRVPSNGRTVVGAITADAVITVGEDGLIRRLERDDGAMSILYENSDGMGALPTVVGDTLFVSSYDGWVRAIDPTTGAQRWHVQVRGQPTMPVVVNGRIHLGTSLGRAIIIGDPTSITR